MKKILQPITEGTIIKYRQLARSVFSKQKKYSFKILMGVFVLTAALSFTPVVLNAQQTGIQKPPSVNCPVSAYDQARQIKNNAVNFGNTQNFNTFFNTYRKFTNSQSATGGESYYQIKWNVPNTVGWTVEYYERAYNLPVFPNTGAVPTTVYPIQNGTVLPTAFPLSKPELDALNTIHKQVPTVVDKLISDMWLLRFFETECGLTLDLNNIPVNPFEIGVIGYGKTRANSQSFSIMLDNDLWTRSTRDSFYVSGEITAHKEVAPSLKVAYGVEQNNLNFLAPTGGTLLFNSPLANKDVVKIPPLQINVSHLSKDIKNNTIYFTIVDSKNTNLSYIDTQAITLGDNTGLTNFSIPSSTAQTAPEGAISKSGSLMDGICDGPTCGFNDLLKLFRNFWRFILIMVVPIIAIMTAWIGFNFMQNGSEYREKAKEMAWNVIKGLVLIIFAWFIVKTILDFTIGKDSCYSFLGKGKVDPECLEK
jgi:hypothetical protein